MGFASSPLAILLMAWGVVTALLIALVIYCNTLDLQAYEVVYINEKEGMQMGSGHEILIAKMERLKKAIISLAMVSGMLLLACASISVYMGLTRG